MCPRNLVTATDRPTTRRVAHKTKDRRPAGRRRRRRGEIVARSQRTNETRLDSARGGRGVFSCWPDGLDLTPGFYPSGIQRAAQTVFGRLLETRVTSASSALAVLNDCALDKSTHSLTHPVQFANSIVNGRIRINGLRTKRALTGRVFRCSQSVRSVVATLTPVIKRERQCAENYNNRDNKFIFQKQKSAFWQFRTVTASECCLVKLLPYILFEKYVFIFFICYSPIM